ncbi:MAG: 2-amino-4-hydroxy-6-hydroxymethyldihydropteridine diphosphokinase [Syntrophothermus sp.]
MGLGSNEGLRIKYLLTGLCSIAKIPNCKILKVSKVYETKPYGYQEQNNFLNAAALVETDLSLEQFLTEIKEIEKQTGRKNILRWGPRTLDIDILLFNNLVYSDDKISVPHKGMLKRDFVIYPLLDINPELVHPEIKTKLKDINFSHLESNIIRKLSINLFNYIEI